MNPTFASTSLVRLLAQWTPPPTPTTGVDMGARLGPWVGAFEAIGLHAAHRDIHAMAAAPAQAATRAPARPPASLAADFAQTRQRLARAIAQDAALPNETTYAPYKRRHLELQRQMEQAVGALRAQVREVLARATPALRQLAVLDAALDKVVSRREATLLPYTVALLERRFLHLQQAHRQTLQDGAADEPATWRRPGGWLHVFETDWHQALLAELDLRLQPVAGLIEATGIELNHDL